MRKTIQSGRAGDSSLTQLLPRREELEKRIRRTGKNWTLTQYMFASMIVLVVAAGAMLMVRAPVLRAGLVGMLRSLGLHYLVIGMTIKRRVAAFPSRLHAADAMTVRGLRWGLP